MKYKTALTLQSIGELIDRKLDEKLKFTNSKIIGIYGELDEIKQEIRTHRQETKTGFENVYEALGDLADNFDHNMEPRIKRLETKVFAQ